MKLTKTELTIKLARKNGISATKSKLYLNNTLKTIQASLLKGDSVVIHGFGTFLVRHRVSRRGRNPATNTDLQLPALDTIGFIPAKGFRKRLNK